MKKKSPGIQRILLIIAVLKYFMGFDNPIDEGLSPQPDFTTVAAFRNPETQVKIEIMAEGNRER